MERQTQHLLLTPQIKKARASSELDFINHTDVEICVGKKEVIRKLIEIIIRFVLHTSLYSAAGITLHVESGVKLIIENEYASNLVLLF